MTDWIHCNKCFLRYSSGSKFFITSCGHLKCQKCMAIVGNDKRCLVCNSPCEVSTLSNLHSSLQVFFQSPSDFIDKAKQICIFQYNNLTSLLKHVTNRYASLKNEVIKIHKTNQELKKEHAKMQKENIRLRMLLKSAIRGGSMATSTPMVGGSSVGMPDSSMLGGRYMTRNPHAGIMQQQYPGGMASNPMMDDPQMSLSSVFDNSMLSSINITPNSSAQIHGGRYMSRNVPKMMPQQQRTGGLHSLTSHCGPSHAGSLQDPSPAQASIPRYGSPSFPHAAMMSMSHLGLGNKPR